MNGHGDRPRYRPNRLLHQHGDRPRDRPNRLPHHLPDRHDRSRSNSEYDRTERARVGTALPETTASAHRTKRLRIGTALPETTALAELHDLTARSADGLLNGKGRVTCLSFLGKLHHLD